MAVALLAGGFACVAWIVWREMVEREQLDQVRRGERRLGIGRAFWDGFKRGIRIWVIGAAGLVMLAAGVAQLVQG